MVSKGETAGVDGDLEGQHLFAALPKVPPWPTGAGFGSGSRQAACTQITLKKKKIGILPHQIPLRFSCLR